MSEDSKPGNSGEDQALAMSPRLMVGMCLVSALLLLVALLANVRLAQQSDDLGDLVTHTVEVQLQAERLRTTLRGAGRAVLDHVASPQTAPSPDLAYWSDLIWREFHGLRSLVSDNEAQLTRLSQMHEALLAQNVLWQGIVSGAAADRATLLDARRRGIAEIERRLGEFVDEEARLLESRSQAQAAVTRDRQRAALASTLVALLTLGTFMALLRRENLRRGRAETLAVERAEALASANASLESTVQQRTQALQTHAEALERARAQLAELARQLLHVEESERRQLARELHDDFAQRLAALKMSVQLARRGAPQGPGLLADAERVAERCIEQLRERAVSLRPPQLDELGLPEALRSHVEQECARAGVAQSVDIQLGDWRAPETWAIQVFRIVQEGLRNALRHGRPNAVALSLRRDADGGVQLRLRDDGLGPDASAPSRAGLGMAHMRERTELFGGVFAVEAAPPRGTVLNCRWPAAAIAQRPLEVPA